MFYFEATGNGELLMLARLPANRLSVNRGLANQKNK